MRLPSLVFITGWAICVHLAFAQEGGGARSGGYTLERLEAGEFSPEVQAKLERMSEFRQKKIKELEEIIKKRPNDPRNAEIYFMLAETYWEELRYEYLKKRKQYEEAMAKYEKGILTTKPEEPSEDYSISIEYYRRILREFPDYARVDEVLYHLGKAALSEGKTKKDANLRREGAKYLKELEEKFPTSRYIGEAYLALGEYYFEANSLVYAKRYYEKVIEQFLKSRGDRGAGQKTGGPVVSEAVYNYALYKLAWVYFNMREFDKAIDTFKKVVAYASGAKGKGVIEFRDQALNDLIVTYAELEDGWVLARDYFLSVLPEDQAYKKLRMLAELYVAQDKDDLAIALYRHFIEREKTGEMVPQYFRTIFSIYKKLNDLRHLDETIMEALDYFRPGGTWRIAVSQKAPEAVQEADAVCEEYLLWLANYYHKEAQRLNSDELYEKALRKYEVYLSRFDNSPNAYHVNFYYAEILFEKKKDFERAAAQYKRVIERDTKGEYVEDAALGVIYCYEEMLAAAGLRQRAKKGKIEVVKVDPKAESKPIPETELHPLEKEYVAAADRYVSLLLEILKDPEVRKKNPERGQKIPEVMYIAAEVYYRHGQFKEAVKRLKVLFDYDPSSEFAAYAVFTMLDCYQRLKQWQKVEEWARKLIQAKNFRVKSKAELEKIVAIAVTENARLLSMERRYSEALKEAIRVYEEFRKDEKTASKALFNVAALYEAQKNLEMAVKTYLRVVKEFPKSEVAPEALFTVALIYESQTQFEKAAEYFERLEKFKDYPETPTALRNAGLIREALGDYAGAIAVYKKFVKMFPKHSDTPAIGLRIGTIYQERMGKAGLQKAHLEFTQWLNTYKGANPLVVEALTRDGSVLKAMDRIKNRGVATKLFEEALRTFSRLTKPEEFSKAKKFAAQSAFEIADYAFEDFSAIKIPSTLSTHVLAKAVTAKAEALKKAEARFEQVLQYKSGGWSAGALFKIGLLYYSFAKELGDVPVPESLDPEGQLQYQEFLDQTAKPVWDKALKAFERALKLAHDERVYNEFSKACAEYVVKLNPDGYPVAGDELVSALHTKDTLASTSFIRTLRRGDIEVKFVEETSK